METQAFTATLQQSCVIVGTYAVSDYNTASEKIKRAIMRAAAGIITHAYIQIAHLT